MLASYLENLQISIQWAQYEEDIDVLRLARDHMNQLVDHVATMPDQQQQQAYRQIDDLLPMEWPLWMEVCRCEDIPEGVVFH